MTRRLPVDLWPFELIGWLRDMAEAATDWIRDAFRCPVCQQLVTTDLERHIRTHPDIRSRR